MIALILSTDTDECSVNNGGCEHECINSPASFECRCDNGFVLASDGKSCNGMKSRK